MFFGFGDFCFLHLPPPPAAISFSKVLLEEGEFLNSLVDHESDAPLELIAELNNDISELFLLVDPHLELRISRAQLLKRALQIHTNSYATFRVERDDDGVMMEENPTTKLETQVQRRLGLAVYALGSMFNHSCQPNAVVSYADGNELVIRYVSPRSTLGACDKRKTTTTTTKNSALCWSPFLLSRRALRVITKGEHVYHSYGPLATKEPRVKRRDILRSKFFFECNCAACVPQDAEHAEEPLGSLLEEELQWESDDILDQLERTTSFAQFRELATRAEAILAKWEASDSPISSNVGWVKAGELADRLAHRTAVLYCVPARFSGRFLSGRTDLFLSLSFRSCRFCNVERLRVIHRFVRTFNQVFAPSTRGWLPQY